MILACEVWCTADVSSVSPASGQTEVWCTADVSSVGPASGQTEVWCTADVSSVSPASGQTDPYSAYLAPLQKETQFFQNYSSS